MALDWSLTFEIPTDTNENLKDNYQTMCPQPINEERFVFGRMCQIIYAFTFFTANQLNVKSLSVLCQIICAFTFFTTTQLNVNSLSV